MMRHVLCFSHGLSAVVFLALAGPVGARADEISDAIGAAREAYQAGDLSKTKDALDLASQLVAQKNAEAFGKLLPEALSGWQAEPVQTAAAGTLGLGSSAASRSYTRANGDRIEV